MSRPHLLFYLNGVSLENAENAAVSVVCAALPISCPKIIRAASKILALWAINGSSGHVRHPTSLTRDDPSSRANASWGQASKRVIRVRSVVVGLQEVVEQFRIDESSVAICMT